MEEFMKRNEVQILEADKTRPGFSTYLRQLDERAPGALPPAEWRSVAVTLVRLNGLPTTTFYTLVTTLPKNTPKENFYHKDGGSYTCRNHRSILPACRRSHPIFHLVPDASVVIAFASLMKDPIPCKFGDICPDFTWERILGALTVTFKHFQMILNLQIEFDWSNSTLTAQVWRNSLRTLKESKDRFAVSPSQKDLTIIEECQSTATWYMSTIYPLLDIPAQEAVLRHITTMDDEDLFQRIGGINVDWNQYHIMDVLQKANAEAIPGIFARRTVALINKGIINLQEKRFGSDDMPLLVVCIGRRLLNIVTLLIKCGASPYIRDERGINLYNCVLRGVWWKPKFKGRSESTEHKFLNFDKQSTLNVLQRFRAAWHWKMHHDFPIEFRRQVRTLLLVINRYGPLPFPRDASFIIIQFMAWNEKPMDCDFTMTDFRIKLDKVYELSYAYEDIKYYARTRCSEMKVPGREVGAQLLLNNALPNYIRANGDDALEKLKNQIEAYIQKHTKTDQSVLACRARLRGAKDLCKDMLSFQCAVLKYLPIKVLKHYLNFKDAQPSATKKLKTSKK